MNVPAHLSAFVGKGEDYEWTRIEPLPAKPAPTIAPATEPELHTVPTPPVTPSLPRMVISSKPISYEELAGNLRRYADELVKVPDWQTLLEEKNQAVKLAKREAKRRERKLNRENAA